MATGPAAALLANWEASKREEEWRREAHAQRIYEGSRHSGSIDPPATTMAGSPGFLRIPVIVGEGDGPSAAAESESTLAYPIPLSGLPVLRDRLHGNEGAAGAKVLATRLRTYPAHSWLGSSKDR